MTLDLGMGDGLLATVRDRLRETFGAQPAGPERMDPVSQMVRAMLGSRTKDIRSWSAFMRLASAFPRWEDAASGGAAAVTPLIEGVTHAEQKARQIPIALWQIQRDHGRLELDFLADHTVEAAMGWLCGLTGVGPKVAASVLNFSRLNMRALVVDTHVFRVARRVGLVSWGADEARAHRELMGAAPDRWTSEDLLELHWLLKLLGQRACEAGQTRCHVCPLSRDCAKRGVDGAAVLTFPKKAEASPAPP